MRLYRLKSVRENRGLSQQELADLSNVARDGISRYEAGSRDARPNTARKLAEALGVDVADLTIGGKVEVVVGKIDDYGIDRREVLRFTGESLHRFELSEVWRYGMEGYMELYECSGGYRVFVDFEEDEKGGSLYPEDGGDYEEFFTADEVAEEYPDFAPFVGRRRVRDID